MVKKSTAKTAIKCPECGSTQIWHVGYVPTKAGKKARAKCYDCATTFYPTDAVTKSKRSGSGRKS